LHGGAESQRHRAPSHVAPILGPIEPPDGSSPMEALLFEAPSLASSLAWSTPAGVPLSPDQDGRTGHAKSSPAGCGSSSPRSPGELSRVSYRSTQTRGSSGPDEDARPCENTALPSVNRVWTNAECLWMIRLMGVAYAYELRRGEEVLSTGRLTTEGELRPGDELALHTNSASSAYAVNSSCLGRLARTALTTSSHPRRSGNQRRERSETPPQSVSERGSVAALRRP
jgi:hypothetical protein